MLAVMLAGCNLPKRKTAAECIPSEIGAPEGFWLYKRNLRMRTDGSEKEELVTGFISPDGTEYGTDGWYIYNYKYITEANKVLFVIKTDKDTVLYGYDYKNKTGESLHVLPSEKVFIQYANGRIFVSYEYFSLLMDYEFNILYADEESGDALSYGTFAYGIAYRQWFSLEDNCSYFVYYTDKIHRVTMPLDRTFKKITVNGDYIYAIHSESIVAINMKTESVTPLTVFDTTYDPNKYSKSRRIFEEYYFNGDDIYVFSVVYRYILNDPNEETDWFYELHKITGSNAELVYDFGSARWGAVMQIYENNLYFQVNRGGKKRYIYYYQYNPQTGKMNSIKEKKYHETPIVKQDNVKRVGEYEFYITYEPWGYSGFLTAPEGYCYYLMRKHGDKSEVMQYTFNTSERDFYDDICEF